MTGPTLQTDRVILRRWRDSDRAPFAAMNADTEVMRYFPAPLTREASDEFVNRIERHFDRYGFGLWALERRDTGEFIGQTGLVWQTFEAPFTPAVEIGWRLAAPAWHQGFATEAATAARDFAFTAAGLDDIVSMTAAVNTPSQAVMQRIGLTHDPADDFEHPSVAGGPLRQHVLYRLSRTDWQDGARTG